MMIVNIILVGGSGKRFWPLSTTTNPKQFIDFFGKGSLIRLTVNRLKKKYPLESIFLVTNKKYEKLIKESIPEISYSNIIYEPSPKNTAPAIALAVKKIYKKYPESIMRVFPADHYIKGANFYSTLKLADSFINKNPHSLLTIGIEPKWPSTGYGYISFQNNIERKIHKVSKFIEKPNKVKAKRLIKSKALWNSGIFIWKTKTIMEKLKNHLPSLYKLVLSDWESIDPISIDFGLMEKTKNIFVISARFEWNDFGTWDAIYDFSNKDENLNSKDKNLIAFKSKNNFVFSPNRKTIICDVEGLIIINIKNITLILPKGKSEQLKTLVKFLEENNFSKLL